MVSSVSAVQRDPIWRFYGDSYAGTFPRKGDLWLAISQLVFVWGIGNLNLEFYFKEHFTAVFSYYYIIYRLFDIFTVYNILIVWYICFDVFTN